MSPDTTITQSAPVVLITELYVVSQPEVDISRIHQPYSYFTCMCVWVCECSLCKILSHQLITHPPPVRYRAVPSLTEVPSCSCPTLLLSTQLATMKSVLTHSFVISRALLKWNHRIFRDLLRLLFLLSGISLWSIHVLLVSVFGSFLLLVVWLYHSLTIHLLKMFGHLQFGVVC